MELIAFLIVVAAVKKFLLDAAVDGIYALKGKTPPRYQMKLAKRRAAAQEAGEPARYGARDFVRDLWHDAVEDAREKRVDKRAQAKAERDAEQQPAVPDSPPAVPRLPVFVPTQRTDEPDHAGDGPADTAAPEADAPAGEHGAAQTPDAPASGDGDQHSPLATVFPIRPNPQEGSPVSTTDTTTNPGPAVESTGLTTAIAYAQQMSQAMSGNLPGTDQWIAQLSDRHGVTGDALASARRAVELQQQAAAAWGSCAAALGTQTTVREAYTATPGAGTREFVTSE